MPLAFAAAGLAAPALPAGDEVGAAIDRCRPGLHARLPALDADQLEELAAGEVLRIVDHAADPEAPSTAIGLAVLEGSLDTLWIAAQDPHANVDPSITEFVVEQLGPDHALWYGHLDLPSPLTDRQWVVESENNHALAASTGCWEHHWNLRADMLPTARARIAAGAHPRLDEALVDDAIFTPVNHGGWLLAPIGPDRTVVVYQATSVVGGAIPDWLVLKLTTARLESVLRSLEDRARTWSSAHYAGGHAPLLGADGVAVRAFPR